MKLENFRKTLNLITKVYYSSEGECFKTADEKREFLSEIIDDLLKEKKIKGHQWEALTIFNYSNYTTSR